MREHDDGVAARMSEFPSRRQALIFRCKATLLQIQRTWHNTWSPALQRPRDASTKTLPIIGESMSALWSDGNPAEQALQAGKVQNLRVAVRRINGVEIGPGDVFSFWSTLGRTTRRRGYVHGRELREGCLIPSIGGGLCQLSNALYDAALKADFDIVERHAHSSVVPGSLAEHDRDATVFWNYVDLRFKSAAGFRIEAELTSTSLIVRVRGSKRETTSLIPTTATLRDDSAESPPRSCASCGITDCFRNIAPSKMAFGCTAYIVDTLWPEFAIYVSEQRRTKDMLILPLDGKIWRKPAYAWPTAGFAKVCQSRWLTLARAWHSRRLGQQGAARQRLLLRFDERLAHAASQALSHAVTHLVVTQSLLPFLWRDGVLGGRTFDVLLTRQPMRKLQHTLDTAAAMHPRSRTLADFRAEDWLAKAETEALQHARRIITPHAEMATLFADRAVVLPWKFPEISPIDKPTNSPMRAVFPGPTAGRKGVYELRDAAQQLGLRLTVVGAQLEGPDFWPDADLLPVTSNWLDQADLVIAPSYIEHQPRILLQAIARGIPVIASNACGLGEMSGVISVPEGNLPALVAALREALAAHLLRGHAETSAQAINVGVSASGT